MAGCRVLSEHRDMSPGPSPVLKEHPTALPAGASRTPSRGRRPARSQLAGGERSGKTPADPRRAWRALPAIRGAAVSRPKRRSSASGDVAGGSGARRGTIEPQEVAADTDPFESGPAFERDGCDPVDQGLQLLGALAAGQAGRQADDAAATSEVAPRSWRPGLEPSWRSR